MPFDLAGPADAPGAVTVRPADTRSPGAVDTWFKDCTDPNLNDGTAIKAEFLNHVLANWRSMARANGNAGGGAAIVVEANDDDLLLKSFRHLIQRGQMSYGVAAGTPNALTVTLSPPLAEYKAGTRIHVKAVAANTGPVIINCNGLGNRAIKRVDGADLAARDLAADGIVTLIDDGSFWQAVTVPLSRNILTAPRTYYVNSVTGHDTNNNGLSVGAPFATIQRALNVMSTFNSNGFDITISLAAGSYAPVVLPRITGSGKCFIVGDVTTPANCHITGSATCVVGQDGIGTYHVDGVKYSSSGGNAISADGSGVNIYLGCPEFGSCPNGEAHMVAQRGAVIVVKGTYHGVASPFVRISGGSRRHFYSLGVFAGYPQPLTITAAVTFSQAFAAARLGGTAELTYSSVTGAANVTGKRYEVIQNAVINTGGGGVSYFPGTIVGSVASGGQYL